MKDTRNGEQAVELLQQLGLKEYEAKSFVALTRRQSGTAKDISETSDVPRTRVYDAIRVLESKGLVGIQHTSPQLFRAVSIDEAVDSLQFEYEERVETLRKTLEGLEPVDSEETEVTHEVWALSGGNGITARTLNLIDESESEVVIILGHRDVFTEKLVEHLQAAKQRGATLVIGAITPELRDIVQEEFPDAEVFVSGLEWLSQSTSNDDRTEISRLLLVDRETILVSSRTSDDEDRGHEQAVFGRGFDNGLVTIVRRLMETGILGASAGGSQEA